MSNLIPTFFFLVFFVFLFYRESKLEQKKQRERERVDDEHILREVARFLEQMKERSL